MKRHLLKLILLLLLTAALLYFFGRSVEWSKIPAEIARMNVPLFLLVVLLVPTYYVTRAVRWHVLIAPEN